MQVLEYQQHRSALGKPRDLLDKGLHDRGAPLSGLELRRVVTPERVDGKQRREQRDVLAPATARLAHHLLEAGQTRLRIARLVETGDALQMRDEGIERTVLVKRRALEAQAGMRLPGHVLAQRLGEP